MTKRYTILEVIDRSDGLTVKISLGNREAVQRNLEPAADFNNITVIEGMRRLKAGQSLMTFGYIRRLA